MTALPRLTRGFARWWLSELAGMLPQSLTRRGGRERAVITWSDDSATVTREGAGPRSDIPAPVFVGRASSPAEMASLLDRIGTLPLVLRLEAGRALWRRVTLPLAAEDSVRQALTFEMECLTPWPVDLVSFDYRLAGRDAARGVLELDLVVAHLDEIQALLECARHWGISPDRLEAEGHPGFDLMPPGIRQRRDLALRLTVAFALLACISAAIGLTMGLERREAAAQELRQEAAALMERAEAASALRLEIETFDRDTGFLTQRKRTSVRMVAVLDQLSRILPDEAWLAQLDIKDGEIEIVGWSPSASVVVRGMEQSAAFARAEFRSPLVQDSRMGLERFHIAARLILGNS